MAEIGPRVRCARPQFTTNCTAWHTWSQEVRNDSAVSFQDSLRAQRAKKKGLATVLEVWRQETMYAKGGDLLFPSYRKEGKQPRLGSMIVQDYIRPATILAGVSVGGKGRASVL